MFANKENVVLQNRNLGMKTPAAGKLNPKTPFKIPLNDENNAGTIHPKTGKKLFGGRDASAFVTPVGPRRPALAGKTTNVKARQLAPSGGKGKQVELVKSSQPVTEVSVKQKQVFQDEDYVPDVEYCPPTPVDLPYIPDDIQLDIGADLHNGNYMAGCHRAFLSGLDADGRSKTQRDMDANFRAAEAELDAETAQLLAEMKGLTAPAPRKPSTTTTTTTSTRTSRPAAALPTRTTSSVARRTAEPKRSASSASSRPASSSSRPTSRTSSRPSSRGPSTTDSRRAAHLLSRPSTSASTRTEKPRTTTTRPLGSFAQPTASSHSRSQSTHHAAVLASKSTIGYTHGREVKKELAKPKRETAMEAMQRIQREDEERYGPVEEGGWGMMPVTESADEITPELEDNGIVEEFLEIVDDADFMLEMPEY